MKLAIGIAAGLLETVVITYIWKMRELLPKRRAFISALTAALSIVLSVLLFRREYAVFDYINIVTVYVIVCILAGIDYRTKTIPNKILAVGMVIRTVLYLVEAVLSADTIRTSLIMAVAGFLFGLLLLLLLAMLTRKGIGYGDVKLFAWLGYCVGIRDVYSILFYSALFSAAVGTYLILRKKADRKKGLPFAPAVLAGTYLVFCLSFLQ